MSKSPACHLTASWPRDWEGEPQAFIPHDSLSLWWHNRLSVPWTRQFCSYLFLWGKDSPGDLSRLSNNICGDWAGSSLVVQLGDHTTSSQPFAFHSSPTADGVLKSLHLRRAQLPSMLPIFPLSLSLCLSLLLLTSPTPVNSGCEVTRSCRNKTGLVFSGTRLHSPHSLMMP